MICNGLRCPRCKDVIYSRAGHDFHYCSCGDCFVDGGQEEYGGRWGFAKELPESVKIDVSAVDKRELANDYYRNGKYGIIKAGTIDLSQTILPDDPVRPEEPQLGSVSVGVREGDTAGVPEQLPPVQKKKRIRKSGQ